MSGPTRRSVLAGLAALPACSRRLAPPLQGAILGRERLERGHRLREGAPPRASRTERADVVIVGGGVAGLSAAWWLARSGFRGRVVLAELGEVLGGTSSAGSRGGRVFPWGAHYITLPSPECHHMRGMLEDFGVIRGYSGERPRYDPAALCLAPQERLFVAGEWIEGLWPEPVATPEDDAQKAVFDALCATWTARVGADGRPAFAIPVAESSQDPLIRALAGVGFVPWLESQGLTSPVLRWWIDYACRDDYGAPAAAVSAWGGLHYFCSRRPDPADDRDLGTHVLTWPAGNGWLVGELAARTSAEVVLGAVARAVDAERGTVVLERGGEAWEVTASAVILAVPARVAERLVPRGLALLPPTAPWRVAQLHCDRPPHSRGVSQAWDSVLYEGAGLGTVSSTWQEGAYGGPTVLSWYEPLDDRAALLDVSWEGEAERVLADLAPGHRDLRERVQRLDVWHWGHGTVVPAVGVHAVGALSGLRSPLGRVHFAHTDHSGLSLFEEASYHGVRAAKEVMEGLS